MSNYMEINGKNGKAVVFTDVIDPESISQIIEMLGQPFAEGSKVRMMPDVHAGKGCTIGTTMTIRDKVCPNIVGVDIGCGMYAIRLEEKEIDFGKLDRTIRENIPSGFDIRSQPHRNAGRIDLSRLRCAEACDLARAYNSIGTLGGGNHFIEVDIARDGSLWLVIHSGSRHLGVNVASYYQKEAVRALNGEKPKKKRKKGQQAEPEAKKAAPDALCWCEGRLMDDYIHDMKLTQEFAMINRHTMAEVIMAIMGLHAAESFTTIHNYIDVDRMIIRKGAVSAEAGERLIIPMNMQYGSLICTGRGNPDWNYSAPHGAGRLLSRSQAKKDLNIEDFEKSMEGIWTTSVSPATIDESPMVYKNPEDIIENIQDTVTIDGVIKPLYNFKAS